MECSSIANKKLLLSIIATAAILSVQTVPVTAQAQGKLSIIMKINNPSPSIGASSTFYDVYNITTTNLNKMLGSQNNASKIEFKQKDIQLTIDDRAIDYTIPINLVDLSTPNIIRSKPDRIMTSTIDNYTKEINTQSNITTYTGQGGLFHSSNLTNFPVDYKAVIYPNGTGMVITRER